ncbi:hypothetical protein GCM10009001_02660 [Virgibacillus siamensis]|uniref:Chromosome partition protein Smc n=1 Tax=Virgibacillus siamensis TaxID=480071 RepID=A0ABN1FG82_9BACI
MTCKQFLKKSIFLSLIILLITVSPIQLNTVHADKSNSTEKIKGFTIKSEKVDGQIGLLGTLNGEVRIKEGVIHGLTITKVLNTGSGQEPMMVKITSPGPVKVENLYAETVNNSLPGIGGVCAPGKVGWLCLKDVVMKVTKQTVADISLPDTTIKACYVSDCDGVPEYNPLSKEEIKNLLNKKNEQEKKVSSLNEGIKQDKQALEKASKTLNKAEASYEEIEKNRSAEKLTKLTESIREILKKDFSERSKPPKKVIDLIEKLENDVKLFNQQSKTFTSLLHEAAGKVQDLEQEIKSKKEMLRKLIENDYAKILKKSEQAAIYAKLLDKMQAESNRLLFDGDNKQTPKPAIDKLKKELKSLKKELKLTKENAAQLKEKKKSVTSKSKTITKNIADIKSTLEEKLEVMDSTSSQKATKDSSQPADKEKNQQTKKDTDSKSSTSDNSNSQTDPAGNSGKTTSKNKRPDSSKETKESDSTKDSGSRDDKKEGKPGGNSPVEDLTDTLTDLLTGGLL